LGATGCGNSPENKWLRAATKNDVGVIAEFLNTQSVGVNYRHEATGTALGSASALGHVELVKLLLDRGADPNIANKYGLTPLLSAAYHGSDAIVAMLIRAGADVDAAEREYGYTPLGTAARKGHIETVRLLLDAGADRRITTYTGKTPYQLAIENRHGAVATLIANPPRSSGQAAQE
jgi:ankyrin repeat protein